MNNILMSTLISTVTDVLSIGAIFLQVAAVVMLIGLIAKFATKKQNAVTEFVGDNAIIISLAMVASAMIGSLFYSEVAGYEPCILCWYQRIVMYPQVITLGLALWDKNRGVIYSSLVMSVIGFCISAYQYLGQVGATELKCDVITDSGVSCSQQFVLGFGYITIPLMAMVVFAVVIMAMLTRLSNK